MRETSAATSAAASEAAQATKEAVDDAAVATSHAMDDAKVVASDAVAESKEMAADAADATKDAAIKAGEKTKEAVNAAGEKIDELQPFHPERMASRILGMGDVLSLVEDVQRHVDQEKAEKLANKLKRGKGFDLTDFHSQLEQMQNMGGLGSLVDKLPGMGELPEHVKNQVNDKQTAHMMAIINSMTLQERRFPDVIRGSRKKRIALGSGMQVQDINRMLKQFSQMQKMMKKFGKGGMKGLMRKMASLKNQMPPGGGFR